MLNRSSDTTGNEMGAFAHYNPYKSVVRTVDEHQLFNNNKVQLFKAWNKIRPLQFPSA